MYGLGVAVERAISRLTISVFALWERTVYLLSRRAGILSMSQERFEQSGTRERNLGMELVRVTEAAALSAGRWMGRGDKEKVDQAAVDAMRQALNGVDMHGFLVLSYGHNNKSPILHISTEVGNFTP